MLARGFARQTPRFTIGHDTRNHDACTMTKVQVHACAVAIVLAYTMAIVLACATALVNACTMEIVAIVHAYTLATVDARASDRSTCMYNGLSTCIMSYRHHAPSTLGRGLSTSLAFPIVDMSSNLTVRPTAAAIGPVCAALLILLHFRIVDMSSGRISEIDKVDNISSKSISPQLVQVRHAV